MIHGGEVERFVIFSHWLGLSEPPSHAAKFEALAAGDRFRIVDPPELKNLFVSVESVSVLLTALEREPLDAPNPKLLGMSPELVQKVFGSDWTDDSPVVRIKLFLKDGSNVTCHSSAQHDYMIPWTVTEDRNRRVFTTFDSAISLSIAGLLPKTFLNRERLLGRSLAWIFNDYRRSDSGTVQHSNSEGRDNQRETEAQIDSATTPSLNAIHDGSKIDEPILRDIDAGLLSSANPPYNPNLFKTFLSQGADVNCRRPEDGLTGLAIASAGGMQDVAAAWIAAGADVNLAGYKGETALMMAASWPEIVRMLLDADAYVNAVDVDGSSALMYAVLGRSWSREQRKIDVVKMLLSADADATLADKTGHTAHTYAMVEATKIRIEREVQKELLPLGVDNQNEMDFEFFKDADGKDRVKWFEKSDGTALCRLLESVNAKP